MDNWMKKAQELQAAGKIPEGFGNLSIAHDDWCLQLRNGSMFECNCNPDVTYYPAKDEDDFVATAILLNHRGPEQ